MRIAVCDDNLIFLEEMQKRLNRYPDVGGISLFSNMEHFFEELEEGGDFDLVMMDLDWKGEETGLEFAERLYRSAPHMAVIYITGYNDRFAQHVLLSETNLIGYLTKPVGESILARYLEKVRAIRSRSASSRWEIPIWERRRAIFSPQRLFFPSDALLINIKTSCSWKQRNQYLLCSDKMPDNLTFTKCQIARK